MIHILDYLPRLIIYHFYNRMYNVELASRNNQYIKACCSIFYPNNHYHGWKYCLTIKLIQWWVFVCTFLWDSVAIEIEFRTMIFCLCHSGISLLAIHIQPCVNTIVLFICGECCLFVCSNHVILYCSINTEIFSFFSIIFYLIP